MVLKQLNELAPENPDIVALAAQHIVTRSVERDTSLSAEKLLRGAGIQLNSL